MKKPSKSKKARKTVKRTEGAAKTVEESETAPTSSAAPVDAAQGVAPIPAVSPAAVEEAPPAQQSEATTVPSVRNAAAGGTIKNGLRLFALAGRPTVEQLILVYGAKGPAMTWSQREATGVTAEKFQEVLAEKSNT